MASAPFRGYKFEAPRFQPVSAGLGCLRASCPRRAIISPSMFSSVTTETLIVAFPVRPLRPGGEICLRAELTFPVIYFIQMDSSTSGPSLNVAKTIAALRPAGRDRAYNLFVFQVDIRSTTGKCGDIVRIS